MDIHNCVFCGEYHSIMFFDLFCSNIFNTVNILYALTVLSVYYNNCVRVLCTIDSEGMR